MVTWYLNNISIFSLGSAWFKSHFRILSHCVRIHLWIWRKFRQIHSLRSMMWLSNLLWRNRFEFYTFLTFCAANLLTSTYVPANGIELIVLPLHDVQILPTSGPKKDAFQKQWLQRANWTCFEILPSFVIGSRLAVMVLVVVIVLNCTSPHNVPHLFNPS